jgi:adenylate kinase
MFMMGLKMIVVFLGPPGSGKGTYSKRIADITCVPHISTGDIFREAIHKKTPLGIRVQKNLARGELVPNGITTKILRERISHSDCEKGFILDGYPRTLAQAHALDNLIHVDLVINLVAHEEVLVTKLSARRICAQCGEIYNLANINKIIDGLRYDMPSISPQITGVCDKCGGGLVHRKDDQVDVISHRLQINSQQTIPIVNFYRLKGTLEDINVNLGLEKTIPIIVNTIRNHT